MANTYAQIYTQIVFSPSGRQNLILPAFEEELYKFITGIIKNQDQYLLAINGMPDHIHIFIRMRPNVAVSELVRTIKASSSKFINESGFLPQRFAWQSGFGCFTYAHSQVPQVIKYVLDQKEHHRQKTFREEYLEFLDAYDIQYDDRYLFDFHDQT